MNTERVNILRLQSKKNTIFFFFFFADNVLDDFSVWEFQLCSGRHSMTDPDRAQTVHFLIDVLLLPAGPVSVTDRTR